MTTSWKPACDIDLLHLRAKMLATIRQFFYNKSVLEVETPLLCRATGTDPQIDFFSSVYHCSPNNKTMYLQTSPEFAMKRLLAAGSGSIFQICKAFRHGELGRMHNPEFTILEWYRVGMSLTELMNETVELLTLLSAVDFEIERVKKLSYAEVFYQYTGLDALVFRLQDYQNFAINHAMKDAVEICGNDHSMWLDLLFSYKVQPELKAYPLCMVYGYPAIQSSLARLNERNDKIVDRFEVFMQGVEIGNGFFELKDRTEQECRFDRDNQARARKGLPLVEKDKLFLQALEAGLPDCSGIAIGLDRLLMIISGKRSLAELLAFPFDRA